MMQRLQPPEWVRPRGYSHGIAARGTLIVLAGQLGWDAQERLVGQGYAEQAVQALRNIVSVLREADAGPEHLVRLTWYLTDRDAWARDSREVGQAFKTLIGHYPTMSAFEVKALLVPGAMVEIEAMAVKPD